MIAKYIRVSSLDQNTARQEKSNVDKLYIDKVSGAVPFAERLQGKKLIQDIERGIIKELIVHSIDRLGRNHLDIATTLQYLEEKEINVRIENLKLSSYLEGKKNASFNLIASILSVLAQQERENLLERQKEGIAIAKLQGKYKGRNNGTVESKEQFLQKYRKVVTDIAKEKYSLREIAKLNNVSLATVQKVKKHLQ